jgi:uncharacterized protein (TIGR04222 family)
VPEFLLLYGILASLSMALVRMGYDLMAREPGERLTSADNLSPLQMAFLVGGEKRSVATAMLGLVLNGRVEPVGNRFHRREADSTTTADTPLERALLGALNGVSKLGQPLLMEVARERELFVPLRRSLEEQGLIRCEAALARGRVWATLVLGGLWWLGMVRLGQGLEAGRPVGFLILCLLCVTLGWLRVVVLSPPRQTKRGEVMGRQLSRDATFNDRANQPPEHQLSTFAVLGWVSLPTSLALSLDVAGLQTVQSFPPSAGGGGDAVGGCGGDGGGGCGGCGGCGG